MAVGAVPFVADDEEEDDDGRSGLTRLLARGTDDDPAAPASPPPAADPGATLVRRPAAPQPGEEDVLPTPPQYKAPDADAAKSIYARIAADSKPNDPSDPSLKPSILRRIAGSLAAGAMAYDHIPGALQAGHDAIYSKYDNAEQQRQGRLAADQSDLSGYNAQASQGDRDFERNLQTYNGNLAGYTARTRRAGEEAKAAKEQNGVDENTLAPDDPANPLGTWHGSTIGGAPVKGVAAPDKFLKTPAGQIAVATAEADKLGLTGDDRKYYLANSLHRGALADPRVQDSKGEMQRGMLQMRLDAAESRQRERLASDSPQSSAGGGNDDKVSAIVADATAQKQKFADQFERQPDGSYLDQNGKPLSAKEFTDKIDGFRTTANKRLAGLGAQIDETGQVQQRRQPAQQPVAAQQQPAPQAVTTPHTKQQVKIGDSVSVGGKTYKVTGINPKTSKPILSQ